MFLLKMQCYSLGFTLGRACYVDRYSKQSEWDGVGLICGVCCRYKAIPFDEGLSINWLYRSRISLKYMPRTPMGRLIIEQEIRILKERLLNLSEQFFHANSVQN